jgi:cysteine desulfurase/selenocysteine lyase
MDNIEEIRSQFPALRQTVYGKPLIYFDNAATSQRPRRVLDMQAEMSSKYNANIHRAVHFLSSVATERYEAGREAVRQYIDAESREEVIFTSGCTASLNLVANCFSERFIGKGDVVIISQAEHHSNIVPWQFVRDRKGAELKVVPVLADGSLDLVELKRMLKQDVGRVRIVALTQISNVLGIVNDIAAAAEVCHAAGVPILIDGAQGIVHHPVSVRETDVDFYAFSGHKIYAPTGIGVLYGKRKYLEEMPPFMGGGDMIDTVTFEKTTYAPLPLKYEAGTANFVAASCFAPALEFAKECQSDANVKRSLSTMTDYLMDELPKVEGLSVYGTCGYAKAPVFSMSIEGCHHEDLAQIMDKMGIALRSGHMCAEPLINSLGHTGLLRASLMPYNTLEECETFISSLKRAAAMLR